MNTKILLLTGGIFFSSFAFAQEAVSQKEVYSIKSDVLYEKTIRNIKEIIPNQKALQNKLLEHADKRGMFKSVNELNAVKKKAKNDIKSWYSASLDSIGNGTSKRSIQWLDSVRYKKEAESEAELMRMAELMYAKNRICKDMRVFPVFTSYMGMLYDNTDKDINFFQNTTLNFGQDNASFKNEIVSGYLWSVRTSLSTVLARENKKDISADQLQNLNDKQVDSLVRVTDELNRTKSTLVKVISGGGEVNLTFKYPLLNFFGNLKSYPKIRSDISYRLSADLPVAGSSIPGKEINLFNVFCVETKLIIPILSFNTVKKEGFESFSLFGKFDVNNIGGTQAFYDNLELDKKRFWYTEYSCGLIYKNFLVYYTDQHFNKSALHGMNSGRLGVALVRQF